MSNELTPDEIAIERLKNEIERLTADRKTAMLLLAEIVTTNILTLVDADHLQNKALRMIEILRIGKP